MEKFLRILIVEDDLDRIGTFKSWMPGDVRVVVATSAGKAKGILQRDPGTVYSGILLDYDLERQATDADSHLTGSNVVDSIIQYISPDVPIMVHSHNVSQSPLMIKRLQDSGFLVSRVPFKSLSKDVLLQWVEEVREIREDSEEGNWE